MARYAIKIGEIHLVSDKPITSEQRLEVVRSFLSCGCKQREDDTVLLKVKVLD